MRILFGVALVIVLFVGMVAQPASVRAARPTAGGIFDGWAVTELTDGPGTCTSANLPLIIDGDTSTFGDINCAPVGPPYGTQGMYVLSSPDGLHNVTRLRVYMSDTSVSAFDVHLCSGGLCDTGNEYPITTPGWADVVLIDPIPIDELRIFAPETVDVDFPLEEVEGLCDACPTPTPTPATTPTPTTTPTHFICAAPCNVTPTLQTINEPQAGGLLGLLFVFGIIFPFVRPTERLIYVLTLLFAVGLFLLTHDVAVLELWVVFAALLGMYANLLRIAGHRV